MIDYHSNIASALGEILPTHYEMTLHSGLKTPCYSYMELNNYEAEQGNTLSYSRVVFQVKIWGNSIAVLQEYALKADKAMRSLGFKRISSGELYDNSSTMIQKILTYEALAFEEFN